MYSVAINVGPEQMSRIRSAVKHARIRASGVVRHTPVPYVMPCSCKHAVRRGGFQVLDPPDHFEKKFTQWTDVTTDVFL